MRRVTGLVLLSLIFLFFASEIAFARSWRRTTVADWKCLDCIKRRMEVILKNSEDPVVLDNARKVLMHVSPMLKRHGGEFSKTRQVVLDSEDGELALIMTQNAYATSAAHWADLGAQMWDDTAGRFWRWLTRLFWTSLFWIVVTGGLWYWLMKRGKKLRVQDQELCLRDEETIATHRAIERAHPDRTERSTLFNDPLTSRAHRRVKGLLGL